MRRGASLWQMTKVPLHVLKEMIAATYDPDVVIDMLDISVEQILEAFDYELGLRRFMFEDLEGDWDDNDTDG